MGGKRILLLEAMFEGAMNLAFNLLFGIILGVGSATLLTFISKLGKSGGPKPWQKLLFAVSFMGGLALGLIILNSLITPLFETQFRLSKASLYTWAILYLIGYGRILLTDARWRAAIFGARTERKKTAKAEVIKG